MITKGGVNYYFVDVDIPNGISPIVSKMLPLKSGDLWVRSIKSVYNSGVWKMSDPGAIYYNDIVWENGAWNYSSGIRTSPSLFTSPGIPMQCVGNMYPFDPVTGYLPQSLITGYTPVTTTTPPVTTTTPPVTTNVTTQASSGTIMFTGSSLKDRRQSEKTVFLSDGIPKKA